MVLEGLNILSAFFGTQVAPGQEIDGGKVQRTAITNGAWS